MAAYFLTFLLFLTALFWCFRFSSSSSSSYILLQLPTLHLAGSKMMMIITIMRVKAAILRDGHHLADRRLFSTTICQPATRRTGRPLLATSILLLML